MDPGEIVALLGTGTGAAVASFAATLLTIGRPVKHRVESLESTSLKKRHLDEAEKGWAEKHYALDTKVDSLVSAVEVLKEKAKQVEDKATNNERRTDEVKDRMVTLVTDEEFQAHSAQTATSLNALTDKIGRAIGALEVWRDRGR